MQDVPVPQVQGRPSGWRQRVNRHPIVAALVERRKQLGMSQSMLGIRIRRSPGAIRHFENDRGGRNLAIVEEIARGLGMRVELVPVEEEQ